ncbi:MAG: alpha/beta fold hydrolase [bacterium]
METLPGRLATVDGAVVNYIDQGDGPVVLLLHGGAWGESAQNAWYRTVEPLAAAGYRVIAPDWIGFGRSDKLRDFVDQAGRMVAVLAALLGKLDVHSCTAAALSMGGSHLLGDLTAPRPRLPVRRLVLVSAGGAPISAHAREALMDFDGTVESMRTQVGLAFADPSWQHDDDYVYNRHATAMLPGAYEWFASLALRPPGATPPAPEDNTPYERITMPALVTAGGNDKLKEPGFATTVADRIPGARLRVFETAGHCPQLEVAEQWNEHVLGFLAETKEASA